MSMDIADAYCTSCVCRQRVSIHVTEEQDIVQGPVSLLETRAVAQATTQGNAAAVAYVALTALC